jgi:hypothetical protein
MSERDGSDIYISPGTAGPVYGYLPAIIEGLATRLADALDRIAELEQSKAER